MAVSTKEKLMFAALDIFSKKGYSASSVDEIAGSIGIKGPNIYKYFHGKEGLFNELISTAEEGYKRKMGLNAERMKTIRSGEELKKCSMEQITFTINDDIVRKMRRIYTIEQFRNEKTARAATFHQYTNIKEMYTELFIQMIVAGVMKKDDPELLALEYLSPVALMIQICDREPDRKDEIFEKIEKHLDHFISIYCIDNSTVS